MHLFLTLVLQLFISGPGVLIAGGNAGSTLNIVELLNLETMTSCVVNVALDQPRQLHTGDGNMVCGGYGDGGVISTCYDIVTRNTINLIDGRYSHTSWSIGSSIYLLGGNDGNGGNGDAARTSEVIIGDTTQEGFELRYDVS